MEQRQPFLPENFFHAGQSAVGQSYAGSDPAAFNYAAQNPLADTNPAEYFFLKDRMGQDLYDKLERTANYEDQSLQQEHAYRFSWPSPLAQDYFLCVLPQRL